MTGHQNNPANGLTISGDPTVAIDLEALAHAIGIQRVTVVDPYDVEGCRKAVQTELAVEEPSLIIARRPCALLKTVKHAPAMHVDTDKCTGCKAACRWDVRRVPHSQCEKQGEQPPLSIPINA